MKKAFTIIELVIVILVLVVLIGLAVPRLKGFQTNANLVKAQKEVGTLMTAVETYKTLDPSHAYPPTTSTLQNDYLMTTTPKMINNILYDPFAVPQAEYQYIRSSNGLYFVVYSVGITGQNHPTAISDTGAISFSS